MNVFKLRHVLLAVVLFSAFQASSQIVIIVNNDNPVGSLGIDEAKEYYIRKYRSRWPKVNKPIMPADRKGSSVERDKFLGDALGMSKEELSQYFTNRQFTKSEAPPLKFGSDEDMIKYVSTQIGAIGYVSLEAYEANQSKVKAICTIP